MTLNIDLNSVNEVVVPSGSANPVLKLVCERQAVWAKVAPGGERVAFANQMMSRAGFEKQGVSLSTGNVALQMVAAIQRRVNGGLAKLDEASKSRFSIVIDDMKARLQGGVEALIFTEDVGGVGTLQSHLREDDARQSEDAVATFLLAILKHAKAKEDLARMLAVDLLLGNFDRLGFITDTVDQMMLHTGNFIVAAAKNGFLPIDNDTVLPAAKNVFLPDYRPPKEGPKVPATVYELVIKGGTLLGEGTDNARNENVGPQIIPNSGQSNMAWLLGENASEAIYKLLETQLPNMRKQAQNEKGAPAALKQLRKVAAEIAPLVRSTVKQLVAELKNPKAGEQSMLKTLKACENIEVMSYSTFKVKSRFAALMTSVKNPGAEQTNGFTASVLKYAEYRDWKDCFDRMLTRNPAAYATTLLTHAPGRTGTMERQPIDALSAASTNLMNPQSSTQQFKAAQLDYRRVLKAYEAMGAGTLRFDERRRAVAALVRHEIAELVYLLQCINSPAQANDLAAACFRKALGKRQAHLKQLLATYQQVAAKICHRGDGRRQVIGTSRSGWIPAQPNQGHPELAEAVNLLRQQVNKI